jgi:transcriptional regulator with XRE-family HTH domain
MPKSTATAAPPRPRLLTRREAAAVLNVSTGTLARWAGERRGPPWIKLVEGEAGSVRYPADLLDDYLARRLKSPKEDVDRSAAQRGSSR